MHTERLISEIVKLMGNHSGEVFFDTPVTIKPSPHITLCNVWGVQVGPDKSVWLYTGDQQWHDLKANQVNANVVAGSVLQRLKLLQMSAKPVADVA